MNATIETVDIPAEALPIEEKSLTIVPQAKSIQVINENTKEVAGNLFASINEALDAIANIFDPLIEKAMNVKRAAEANRKAVVEQKERFSAPWESARKYVVGQLTSYKALMDKKREEEQELLRQAAIKEEMERRKQAEAEAAKAAAELEAAGAKEEAAELLDQVIQENQEPIRPYVPPPSTPKTAIAGGSFRETWHAEVTSLKALCLAIGTGKAATNLVKPNQAALNDLAVAQREQMNIPGVEAKKEIGMAKGRR